MNRGPENVFGKAPGKFDEVMARRLARTLPDQALCACAAMDDETFRDFIGRFNDLFKEGGRVASIRLGSGRDLA